MLSNRPARPTEQDDSGGIHNYYERPVLEEIHKQSERARNGDRDFIADVACVALNHLPPRYIRHDVDMSFFMSPLEFDEMNAKVTQAVKEALAFVGTRSEPQASTGDKT
ncbi:late competence development ComFB family protein [Gilvimarinus xylanilyticus]|uniref:Late competence development ComFB family protein n=1 Tax=Gilvimarinus xylanilyticus TaxID=2944139 RepID=A0A9X2HWZ1_9GAMM|nr:late competence development ComFB family protein [Gilvimarinus xylanilyticus]MCP8899179.1 late competence development ComFB family protein [Gilvimarinus xylanilyticus]